MRAKGLSLQRLPIITLSIALGGVWILAFCFPSVPWFLGALIGTLGASFAFMVYLGSRWWFAAFLTVLCVVFLAAPVLLNVQWAAPTEGQVTQSVSQLALRDSGDSRDSILVVGVFDETVDAVVDFAAENQIGGVTGQITTWRPVHRHVMERLALAGPKIFVSDYVFRTPQPGDADLVAGIETLEAAGIPVVLAAREYDEFGTPDLSPGITGPLSNRLRHGADVARNMVERPGEFIMAIRRGKQGKYVVVPGLPLVTLAALRHTQARLELDWPERDEPLNLLYEIQPGAYLRERDRLELSRAFKAKRTQSSVRAGDLLGCKIFDLDPPQRWETRVVPFEYLLTAPDDELARLVSDKVLIVGDHRTPGFGFPGDRHKVLFDGSVVENVPGCYLLAEAIAGLLDGRHVRCVVPLPPTTLLSMLLLAIVGCPLAMAFVKREVSYVGHIRHLLGWTVLLVLSVSGFFALITTRDYLTIHLGMATFALLAPMCALSVLRARRLAVAAEDCESATHRTIAQTVLGGFPAFWELFACLLPTEVRRRYWLPAHYDLIVEYADYIGRYQGRWVRKWLCVCFTFRTILLVVESLTALCAGELQKFRQCISGYGSGKGQTHFHGWVRTSLIYGWASMLIYILISWLMR